jgi:hypothetical protein
MNFKISRRDLLKSAALTALLSPIISSTMPVRAAPVAPKRLLVLFTPNGLVWPDQAPNGPETTFDIGNYFRPLDVHRADLIALTKMATGGQPYGENTEIGHVSGGIGCLTCTPDEKTRMATGPSVDQFIAQKLKAQGLAPMLKAPVFSCMAEGVSSYSHSFFESAGKPVAIVRDVKKAFDALFYDFAKSSGATAAAYLAKKQSILDGAWDDCKSYVPALPSEGRELLEYHCTRIRELETNLQRTVDVCTPPAGALDKVSALDGNDPRNYPAITDFYWELLEVALMCDMTRVASFAFGGVAARFNMPWLDVPLIDKVNTGETNVRDHHSWTHRGSSGKETVGLFMRWYSQKIAELVTRLKKVNSVGKRLLDSTVVFWTTEFGSDPHNTYDIPNFIFGNGGGAFKTGRHLAGTNEPKDSHALMVSLIKMMGITDVNQFGHPGGGTGPLSKLAG